MTLLKFSKIIINTKYVKLIRIFDNKYHVFMSDNKIASGNFVLGSGDITTEHVHIEVCKKTNLQDYIILDNWINKNTFV